MKKPGVVGSASCGHNEREGQSARPCCVERRHASTKVLSKKCRKSRWSLSPLQSRCGCNSAWRYVLCARKSE
eukprot:3998219-Pleurochrysis_carterae.AAC.1